MNVEQLRKGAFLIPPLDGYCFSLRIERVYIPSPFGDAEARVECTRFDVSNDGEPILRNADRLHSHSLNASERGFIDAPCLAERIGFKRIEFTLYIAPGQQSLF
jgi:hypothetical protein